MRKLLFIAAVCLAGLAGGAVVASATPEKDLANCQKTVGKEIAKYVSAKQKTIATCLNKIAKERIENAAGDAAGAAAGCASALRKLVNTDDPSKELDDKTQAKIDKKCAGEPLVDVLGFNGFGNVAGDTINADEQMGIPCQRFGGDGSLATTDEWLDCVFVMADAQAIRQVHMQYPNADAWLRDVRADIVALGADQKYLDAAAALDSVRRWVDNGDGTVTDYVTGLMWEKKTDDGGIHDKDNKYTWSTGTNNPDGTAYTTFLNTLNLGATGVGNCTSSDGVVVTGGFFAGHCDWRLPTIAELQTIALGKLCGFFGPVPCIDETVFGPTPFDDYYWSSVTRAVSPNTAWTMAFSSPDVQGGYTKVSSRYVRAVRRGF